jgi:hypothetical protein
MAHFRAASPKIFEPSFPDLLTLISAKPLFGLFDRLKTAFSCGEQDRGRRWSPAPANGHGQLEHALATLGIDDLIAMEIPERELLLDPILPAKGLMMIHAQKVH